MESGPVLFWYETACYVSILSEAIKSTWFLIKKVLDIFLIYSFLILSKAMVTL